MNNILTHEIMIVFFNALTLIKKKALPIKWETFLFFNLMYNNYYI